MDLSAIFLTFAAIILALYYFYNRKNYFDEHGILYRKTFAIVDIAQLFIRKIHIFENFNKTYYLNEHAKYVGFFDFNGKPIIALRDLELIRSVTVKNFDHFVNHPFFTDPSQDPVFSNNLFVLRDEKWREVRSLLSPAFTSSKMRSMFKLMSQCAVEFCEFLTQQSQEKSFEIDSQDAFTRYTSDVIATCAFGVTVDSMRHRDNEFYNLGRKAANLEGIRGLKFLIVRSFPKISKILHLKIFDSNVEKFFTKLVCDTIATRDEKGISRPDMIQLMMETRNESELQLTTEEMVSQAFVFFLAGFDTTSRIMCFAAHEISVNGDIQQKLRNEIDEVYRVCSGEPTYEAINSMVYLSAVVSETLRLYTSPGFLDRVCNENFELPPALPGKKPVLLKPGDMIWVPVYSLHRDPKYFSDPYAFSPERFINNSKVISGHPAYFPFGSGPRMCIGNRFALIEIKILLFHLLQKFHLKPAKKMILPLKFKVESILFEPDGGFWLQIHRRAHSSQ